MKAVCRLCLGLCFVCLGAAVYLIATGSINQAMPPISLVIAVLRFNVWFLHKQSQPEQETDRQSVKP